MFDEQRQRILVTVDVVVFTVIRGELHVLLITRKYPPFQGRCAFPGGFVRNDESLEDAAARELGEEAGVSGIFMKKLTAYGAVDRDPRGRVVTVVYVALIDAERFRLEARTDALEAEWMPVGEVGALAFDHGAILADALADLRYDVQTTNVAAQLLPEKFTLSDLQSLYESVLGRALDKRNFRKRIQSLGILSETRETRMDGAHRPARLYRFKDREYRPIRERLQVFV